LEKVIIFRNNFLKALVEEINSWLAENKVEITSRLVSTCQGSTTGNNIIVITVVIFYKDKA
jgi:hypothetical protein